MRPFHTTVGIFFQRGNPVIITFAGNDEHGQGNIVFLTLETKAVRIILSDNSFVVFTARIIWASKYLLDYQNYLIYCLVNHKEAFHFISFHKSF